MNAGAILLGFAVGFSVMLLGVGSAVSNYVQTSTSRSLVTQQTVATIPATQVQQQPLAAQPLELLAEEVDTVAIKEPVAAGLSFNWMLAGALSLAVVPMVQLYRRWANNSEVMYDEDEDMQDLEEEASWALAAAAGEVMLQYTSEIPVKDAAGSSLGKTELCLRTAGPNSRHVIHRKLVAELANRRQSNAHTKTRSEVSGGGKKPYKQKGTGNARRGSSRSPLFPGGGVAFGPRNTKNYKQKINKKEGRLAISSLLQNRAPLITVIKDMENSMNVISTKKAASMIDAWKDPAKGDKVLLVINVQGPLPVNHPLVLSTNNLEKVRLMSQQSLAVADLLWPSQIFVSDGALEALKERFEVPVASEESA